MFDSGSIPVKGEISFFVTAVTVALAHTVLRETRDRPFPAEQSDRTVNPTSSLHFFLLCCYSPNLGHGLPPWNSPFHFSFLDLRQSVGLLGRVISSSQGLCLYRNTKKTHTYTKHLFPCVRFEPTIPASERAKTVHALDRSTTVTGSCLHIISKLKACGFIFIFLIQVSLLGKDLALCRLAVLFKIKLVGPVTDISSFKQKYFCYF
jgi:hypothetical protein